MFNPLDPVHMNRLGLALDRSRWLLQPYREKRVEAIKEFVGYRHSDSGADAPVLLNLLQIHSNILLRQLIPQSPRVMVSSDKIENRPICEDWEAWMNKALPGMKAHESLRACVLDALFCMGIIKIGEAVADKVEIQGTTQYIGQPFLENVDFEDWVHDMTARRPDQFAFCGNRYRILLEEGMENPLYDKDVREQLSPMTRHAFNERGDTRITTISQQQVSWTDEYREHTEVWDLWLPREKLVITVPYTDSPGGGFATKPLRVVNWEGPNQGPFVTLSYCDVPNNVMPAAPLQAMVDLHLMINAIWRKLSRQVRRQKTVLTVMNKAVKDGEKVVSANDGDVVKTDLPPEMMREVRLGGIDGPSLMFGQTAKDAYSWAAGNLDVQGGLSPQAGTLGQEELLKQNSSAQIAELQNRTYAFIESCLNCLGDWWWTNPALTYSATRQVAGLDIPVNIPPQARSIKFADLNLQLDIYSLQHDTPQSKLGKLKDVIQNVLMPLGPMMQQAGKRVKWDEVMRLYFRYMNQPEFSGIIEDAPPPEQQQAMEGAEDAVKAGLPNETTRNYNRHSIPQMTPRGQTDVMSQLLAGGGNGKQAAMMGRPMG